MIKFSIITAVYNREKTIAQSIKSVKSQNYPKDFLEHIIIDGLSSDGTLDIVKNTISENSIIISELDNGINDALNKGLKLATGDIVGLMHSDDFFADDYVLSDIKNAFQDPFVDIVYGDLDYVSFNDSSKVVRSWKSKPFNIEYLSNGWMPPHPTIFLRRSLISRFGVFDDASYRISADYDMMIRYFKIPNITPVYIPRVLVKMRIGGESNKNLLKILIKMHEDYKIIKANKVGGFITLLYKNIGKISQFNLFKFKIVKSFLK